MTKSIRKAKMFRSRFKIISTKKSLMNTGTIIRSKGILLHQSKEKYFSDVNVESISDSKDLWKTIKPFFLIRSQKQYNDYKK